MSADQDALRVGFVGLGRMGRGIAGRVLGGGHDLVVFNRTPGRTDELERAGARVAPQRRRRLPTIARS